MISEVKQIESSQNQLIKRWKLLHKQKGREKHHSMLIEGEHLLKEAIASKLSILAWIVTQEKLSWFQSEFSCEQVQAPLFVLPSSLFLTLTQTQNPQGVAAEVEFPQWLEREPSKEETFVLLDEVQDPGNLGTIIRTSEATNVNKLWLGKGSVDPTNAKVVRSSMGSVFRLPIERVDLQTVIPKLQREGFEVISTSPRAKKNYFQYNYSNKVAFLFGNEARGIKSELKSLVDEEVMIPMWGKTESLNVSITSSVLLYERVRQLSFTCKSNQHPL